MRINIKKYPSIYIVATVATLCLVLAASAWWYFSKADEPSTTNTTGTSNSVEPAPSELSDENVSSKQDFVEQQQEQSDSNTDTSSPSTGTDSSDKIDLVTKQAGSSVTVITKISGIGDGSCRLAVTNGDKSFSQTAEVIYQPSYSTCAGFSIPVAELGKGTWSITVSVTSADGTKTAATSSLGVS